MAEIDARLSDALGAVRDRMTPEERRQWDEDLLRGGAQLESGKSLADIATAKGKTVADLKAALVAALQKRVDAAVTAGELSKADAAAIVTRKTGQLDAAIARKGDGHGAGGGPDGAPGGPPPAGGPPFGSGNALPTGSTGA